MGIADSAMKGLTIFAHMARDEMSSGVWSSPGPGQVIIDCSPRWPDDRLDRLTGWLADRHRTADCLICLAAKHLNIARSCPLLDMAAWMKARVGFKNITSIH